MSRPAPLVEIAEYRLSVSGSLRPGLRFTVGGGPTYRGHREGLRGEFECRRIVKIGTRVFADAVRIENGMFGAQFLLLISGRQHSSVPGWIEKPYRIRLRRSHAAIN